MNTGLSQKSISKTYPTKALLTLLEVLLLISIGAIGVLIHAKFRFPLRLPGHWGLVYMALIFSGRLFSKKPYASSLSSLGAVAMLLLPLGFKDPFMPVLYIFPGFITDVFYNIFKNGKKQIILIALISGVAYMSIPLSRLFLTLFTGVIYGSFSTGYIYPFIMHFLFGACGGLTGLGIYSVIRKILKRL
ncbi:MAG TPA: hypothetical protein PKW80_06895 [Bacteroidales bacterium]|nr:hypothetical protein [Bacteroidales bacterium]